MDLTRRDVLKVAACAPLILRAAPAMRHSLALQPRAFIIDGKPVFLTAGSIDYFRCPHELWRDRLLQAKRGGLNTIAFCIAWNFHEREEGVFRFDGDADLGQFLDICGDLGLYAFPRLGPFICDEWEAGGYPAWLLAKPDIELRTSHPATLVYLRRWLEQVVPILAKRQVTRGGPVLMVQQENEYFFVGRPRVQEYQDWLIENMRELGIEVPITDCNGSHPATRRPASLQTNNGGGAGGVHALQKAQPGKPAFISELYTDWMTCWGWPITSYPTTEMLLQQTMETLGAGGMYAYFMYYGGTNFGFWASTTWKSDQSFITTRYYGRAPLAEGGALNESFFAAKAVNLIAQNLSPYLTKGVLAPLPVKLAGPVRGEAVRSSSGYLLFVHPQHPVRVGAVYHTDGDGALIQLSEEWPMAEQANQAGTLELPSGAVFDLAEPSSYPSVLPYQLEIDAGVHIDFSNMTLLGIAGNTSRRVLLFRGDAGRRGVVSINGQRGEVVVPTGAPARLPVAGVTVLTLSRATADRAWFADGRVIIGPAYVGDRRQGRHECFLDGQSTHLLAIAQSGEITSRPVVPKAAVTARIPFSNWIRKPVPETAAPPAGWRELGALRGVEELGAYWGYSWYRASFHSPQARRTGLHFTSASDRLHVFVNGKRMGVWGRGAGATRDPLPVDLTAGDNLFIFLCDNMGRLSEGAVLDRKGILGPAYCDGRVVDLPAAVWSSPAAPPTNSWPYQTYRNVNSGGKLARASYTIQPRPGQGLQLALRWFPQYAWIQIDGRLVGEHAGDLSLAGGVDFSTFVIDSYVGAKPARLDITLFGESARDFESHVRLLAYDKASELSKWAFRPWQDPQAPGDAPSGHPLWWECEFQKPRIPGPFFIVPDGLSKGQAYLNCHALGRFWEIGPQRALYVPDPWFEAHNRLAILDEEGRSPERVYLMRDARVPVESVLV